MDKYYWWLFEADKEAEWTRLVWINLFIIAYSLLFGLIADLFMPHSDCVFCALMLGSMLCIMHNLYIGFYSWEYYSHKKNNRG